MMEIIKRSGQAEAYDRGKIANAIRKAFISTQTEISQSALDGITAAAFRNARLLADLIDPHRVVVALPDQFERGFEQACARILVSHRVFPCALSAPV